MSWSGGTYRKGNYLTNGWTGDASLGIGIEAGRHDTQDDDFANGINTCLTKDGQNTSTANLPMGGFKHTNVGNGSARNDYAALGQVQDQTASYLGTTGGTSTAFTVTGTPTITTLATGARYIFKANAANGATATLKIDVTAATAMQRQGTALAGNEFKANDIVEVVYDGANFQITNIATAPLFVDRTNARIGIGTTAPASDLEIGSTSIVQIYNSKYSADANGPELLFRKSRGASVGTNTIVQSSDSIGLISFYGANGTTYDRAAYIGALINATPGASADMPGALIFGTAADGTSGGSERFRIDNAGNGGFGLGTSLTNTRFAIQGSDATSSNYALLARNSSSTNLILIRNDGQINLGLAAVSPYNNTTAAAANAVLVADGTVARSTSSLKYKTDIQDATFGLSDVLKLRPVTYKGKNDGDIIFGGLIAEEVDAAGLTEFVQYSTDGSPDALAYGNMVSLAFKAIQDLNAKVEALEARVAELEK